MNYYSHQDECIAEMNRQKSGFIEMPTGTGKGEIICNHAYGLYKQEKPSIKITVTVSHRIMLSQQLLQRLVVYFLNKKEQPNFRRICVHSGDQIEYGLDTLEDQIWVAAYPDDKCGSVSDLENTIREAINLGQDLAISTTYHSLNKTVSVLNSLGIKADACYLDELHRGVERDEWMKVIKKFVKHVDRCYGFTATPGKQRSRINSIVGQTIYYMDSFTAIERGLICKPMWMIVDVEGNKEKHIAKGVVNAFEEHQSRIAVDAKMLVHCFDSLEIASIGDSREIKLLMEKYPELMVAEVSSSRGARINGVAMDRLEWLKSLNDHKGRMIVLHIDICNSGLDVPGFTFGLWTYMSSSETYATQGNGRSGRIVKEDRVRLERGEITTADYSQWVKPFNICGLMNFLDTVEEDEEAFVDFILRSREQGFDPSDIVYTGNKKSVNKTSPFEGDAGIRDAYKQSQLQVQIKIRLEAEDRMNMHRRLRDMDPMSIFESAEQ